MEGKIIGKHVLIIGGGFVGLTLAAKLLNTPETTVTVLEKSSDKVSRFNSGEYGIYEPGLEEIFRTAKQQNRIIFTNIFSQVKFDIVFICINTNKNETNRVDSMINLIKELFANINQKGFICLRSTVPVGTTSRVKKFLEESTRPDLKVFFAPERTAEGMALQELDSIPQIVGGFEKDDSEVELDLLRSLGFKVIRMSSPESAEFLKLMSNIWRDSSFAIVNELAIFSESLKLDIFEIIEKSNSGYPRSKIPYPGPVGGPCLSKDTYLFFESFTKDLRKDSLIFRSRSLNEEMINIAYHKIVEFKGPDRKDLVLIGGAFKGMPRTNDFRNSFAQELINLLQEDDLEIAIWDPTLSPRDLLNHYKYYKKDLDDHFYDIVVIGNNSNFVINNLVLDYLTKLPETSLVVDMWGITKQLEIKAKTYRFGFGN